MPRIQRALMSVSDKTGVVELAKGFEQLGIAILSTGGTAKLLRDAGIDVTEVSEYTGSPEILDGRLKTLHPKIHGGLLGIRDNERHQQEMRENGIDPIDIVVVNLYPFERTVAQADCPLGHAIENIDIGGPTMLRAAAKNYQDVAVLCDPADYASTLEELRKNGGMLDVNTTFALAQKVFAHTARYDAAIATHLSTYATRETRAELPRFYAAGFEQVQELRYGENPQQRAAFYRDLPLNPEPSVVNARQLQGKELSYNNIMDADAAVGLVRDLLIAPYAAAIIKHACPCGAAVSHTSLADAFDAARATDPVSAFGGIVAFNGEVDGATAELLGQIFFEVIVAPAFSPEALHVLSAKKNLRLLEISGLGKPAQVRGWDMRKVVGGMLLQDRDVDVTDLQSALPVTKRAPSGEERRAMDFAWRVCKHVKSNAIVLASESRVLGIGGGQTSRVDSVRIAAEKSRDRAVSGKADVMVMASDAFFPFRDGIDAAAAVGATAVVQPGGSLRDEEVIAAADEHHLAMIFTGRRHFKH